MVEKIFSYAFIVAFIAMVFITSMLIQEVYVDLEHVKDTVTETNQMLKDMTTE